MPLAAQPLYVLLAVLAVVGIQTYRWSARQVVISGYATSLAGRTAEQLANIERAATAIDGTRLLPGRELSLLALLGPTEAAGWSKAPAYRRGEVEEADAGGICQLSSTLYNAALLGQMQITERHAHSMPVASIGLGRDAAVSSSGLDLRFRNVRKTAVTIRADASADRLVVRLTGKPPAAPQAEIQVEQQVSKGYLEAIVWKRTAGGERVLVSRDRYRMPVGRSRW